MRRWQRLMAGAYAAVLVTAGPVVAQQPEEPSCQIDLAQSTTPVPPIFRPQIDLSGRGLHRDKTWPQGIAAPEALGAWHTDIGFKGTFRIQYNLWEIHELAKAPGAHEALLKNYEQVIKSVADEGGTVIVTLFGTPPGMGRVLDKRSPPLDPRAYKALVKETIEYYSCLKKYPVWYEVWSAPELDEFFLGRKQDYLQLYRAVGEAVKELEATYKIHIPLGGPGTTWWLQNFEGNTVATPERSLIYELIRFCFHYRLPLDFLSWHAYSTDPRAEQSVTVYRKSEVELIRAWLSYFHFDPQLPLVVDEWNYDAAANVLPERAERAYVGASFIPARLKGMHDAGIDNAVYFCLEDFQNNADGVVRNVGAFSFDPASVKYRGGPKAMYGVFRMLGMMGDREIPCVWQPADEFVGGRATFDHDTLAVMLYNYEDPDSAMNYLTRMVGGLSDGERKILSVASRTKRLDRFLRKELPLNALHPTRRLATVLKKAAELQDAAHQYRVRPRTVQLRIKNAAGEYTQERYTMDASCALNGTLTPAIPQEITAGPLIEQDIELQPYSVVVLVFRKKTPPPAPAPAAAVNATVTNTTTAGNVTAP